MSDIPEDIGENKPSEDRRLANLKEPWKPGQSGNPAGRPKGARSKFGEDFVKAYAEHWEKNGNDVLDRLVSKHPAEYARIACAILPKVIELDDETMNAIKDLAKAMPFDAIRYRAQSEPEKPHTTH